MYNSIYKAKITLVFARVHLFYVSILILNFHWKIQTIKNFRMVKTAICDVGTDNYYGVLKPFRNKF